VSSFPATWSPPIDGVLQGQHKGTTLVNRPCKLFQFFINWLGHFPKQVYRICGLYG